MEVRDIWGVKPNILTNMEKDRILKEIAELIVNLPPDSIYDQASFCMYPMASGYAIKVPKSRIYESFKSLMKKQADPSNTEHTKFHGKSTGRPLVSKHAINAGSKAIQRLQSVCWGNIISLYTQYLLLILLVLPTLTV
mgnify:FL=1